MSMYSDSEVLSLVCDIPSNGATDWEYFNYNGNSYLAISNEGDIQNRLHQLSYVYRLASIDEVFTRVSNEL